MTTIADSLQNATDALNNAVTNVLAIRDQIANQLTSVTQTAQTTISNFVQGGGLNYLVDPVNGNDANDGHSVTTAMRTLDGAITAAAKNVTTLGGANFFLLGDCFLSQRHNVSFPIGLIGAQWGGGLYGGFYTNVLRTITVTGEASNSPIQGAGRVIGGIDIIAPTFRAQFVNIALPDIAAGLLQEPEVFSFVTGGSIVYDSGTVTAATPTTAACVFACQAPAEIDFNGGIGTNAPGKIFFGIAAGSNPNSFFNFRTNLTSA